MTRMAFFLMVCLLMLTGCAPTSLPSPTVGATQWVAPIQTFTQGSARAPVSTQRIESTPSPLPASANPTAVPYFKTGFFVQDILSAASCPIVSYADQPGELYMLPGCSLGNFFSGATVELSILNPAGININQAGGNLNSMNPGFVVDNLGARTGYLGLDYAIWSIQQCALNETVSGVIGISGIPGGQNVHLEAMCLGILPTSTPGEIQGDPANPDGGGGGPGGGDGDGGGDNGGT